MPWYCMTLAVRGMTNMACHVYVGCCLLSLHTYAQVQVTSKLIRTCTPRTLTALSTHATFNPRHTRTHTAHRGYAQKRLCIMKVCIGALHQMCVLVVLGFCLGLGRLQCLLPTWHDMCVSVVVE